MPEPYWPKRKGSYTLADAEKNNTFASIRCTYCKRQRYYFVADLKTAYGAWNATTWCMSRVFVAGDATAKGLWN